MQNKKFKKIQDANNKKNSYLWEQVYGKSPIWMSSILRVWS